MKWIHILIMNNILHFTCSKCPCNQHKTFLNCKGNPTQFKVQCPDIDSSRITELEVSHQNITTLESNLFSTFDNLIKLDLSFNNITSISNGVLKGLEKLDFLDLSGNTNMKSITSGALDNLMRISYINLSNTKMKRYT